MCDTGVLRRCWGPCLVQCRFSVDYFFNAKALDIGRSHVLKRGDSDSQARGAAGAARVTDEWFSSLRRVHPRDAWGKRGWGKGLAQLPRKPSPCPRRILAYRFESPGANASAYAHIDRRFEVTIVGSNSDWTGAGTNNVILALVNALHLSHLSNRTLLLSAAAAEMVTTLFDAEGINGKRSRRSLQV